MSIIRQHPGFLALTAVTALTIVRPGASDGSCLPATAPTDLLLGASDALTKDIGEMVDVPAAGVAEVLCGAAVTRGQPITADATSRAVPCAPAAGVNHRYIGFALQSGVLGDVIAYQVGLGVMQG